MLFLEQFASARQPIRLHVFATDIDDESLEVARAGIYPASIVADVAGDRLRQFFVKVGEHHYQVTKALRELVTFAPQNVVSDAPFSRLDLISCRNVLIYLQPGVQARVIALFHFALLDGGYLLLGPAESIGSALDRFEPVSRKWRVYRRLGTGRPDVVDIPILPTTSPRLRTAPRDDRLRPAASVGEILHRALLADFAPAAVLINRRYEILSVQGPVVDYLEFPPGELTRDLLAMARPGLRTAIRATCQEATRTHHASTEEDVRVQRQGQYVPCTVTVRPVAADAEDLLLVTFRDRSARGTRPGKKAPARAPRQDEQGIVSRLEHDLRATREDLQATIDELATANEELKASHEEVMSMNEELQSANEELETSKEELQSLNEELSTVNSQLQDKVQELDAANNDLLNLLGSTDIAAVFLDTHLRIKRFTPPAARVLHLRAADLDRPFREIAPPLDDAALLDDCRHVIETLAPVEAAVCAQDSAAYLRRVLPYRTADNRIEGIVITWVDITRRLAAEAASRRLSAVLQDSHDAIALLDLEGRIIGWNRGAERLYGYTEPEARALKLSDLAPDAQRAFAADLLRRIGSGATPSESLETLRLTKDGRRLDVSLTMTLLRDNTGKSDAIATTERDLTGIKEELAAREAATLYQQVIERLPAGAVLREGDRITMNRAAEAITGHSRGDLDTVDAWCAALHGARARAVRPLYEPPAGDGAPAPASIAIVSGTGETRHVQLTVCRLDDTRQLWMLIDVTEHDRAHRTLRQSEDYLQSIVNTAPDAVITIDEHHRIGTFNPAAERMFGYTAAELLGRNVSQLMPPPYRDEHDGYIAHYRATGEAKVIGTPREVVGLRKDGTTFPIEIAIGEIDHRGHVVGVLHDLSQRRSLEWRLAESHLEERRYIARELHDEVGGHVTGIGLLAQSLFDELARNRSPLAAKAEALVQSIGDAHQRLRAVVRGLTPVEAIPEGLMAALEHLAAHTQEMSGVACLFQYDSPVQVADPIAALHLFRIAQEAVNNALRHGEPAHITLGLKRAGDRLRIEVTDDGRGFDGGLQTSGLGLHGMRQRARLLGGDCAVQPGPSGGTVVKCWIPFPAPATPRPQSQPAHPKRTRR